MSINIGSAPLDKNAVITACGVVNGRSIDIVCLQDRIYLHCLIFDYKNPLETKSTYKHLFEKGSFCTKIDLQTPGIPVPAYIDNSLGHLKDITELSIATAEREH